MDRQFSFDFSAPVAEPLPAPKRVKAPKAKKTAMEFFLSVGARTTLPKSFGKSAALFAKEAEKNGLSATPWSKVPKGTLRATVQAAVARLRSLRLYQYGAPQRVFTDSDGGIAFSLVETSKATGRKRLALFRVCQEDAETVEAAVRQARWDLQED